MRCAGTAVMSWPRKIMWPPVGVYRRLIRLKIVVLPAPLGPMMAKTSPSSTSKDTLSTARMPPKRTASSWTLNNGI